eukprot:scaffold107_cov106-Isochrysis_galbana.AAC.14
MTPPRRAPATWAGRQQVEPREPAVPAQVCSWWNRCRVARARAAQADASTSQRFRPRERMRQLAVARGGHLR